MNLNKFRIIGFIFLSILLLLSMTACDNTETVDTTLNEYNTEVIIDGVASKDHNGVFSISYGGSLGIDQFKFEDNKLIADITELSGKTELTLVINNDNLKDGKYTADNKVIEINSDNNKVKFEVKFQEEPTYNVSVNYDNGTIEGDGEYKEGEEVELIANAAEGYQFEEWTGYQESTDNPLIFDMPAENVELIAYFENTISEPPKLSEIDINNEVSNISVEYGTDKATAIDQLVSEIVIVDTVNKEYTVGLTWSINNYDNNTASNYIATGKFNLPDGIEQTDPPTALEVEAEVKVKEEPTYNVSVNYDNGTIEGDGEYKEGEEVELIANAAEGYQFEEWTGYQESTDNPLIFDMPKNNVELTALFDYKTQKIGESYEAADGLTVTLNSLEVIERSGSYQYNISYELSNRKSYAIDEGAFKLYYSGKSGGLPQYGFFDKLFPGDTVKRTYTFEEEKHIKFEFLSYHYDQFFEEYPPNNSLLWEINY